MTDLFERIRIRGNPAAHAGSIVTCGGARFTVLTPRLIRMEWATDGQFIDQSTFAFPNRFADVPAFTRKAERGGLEIQTEYLTLRYADTGEPFNASNLSITLQVDGQTVEWKPGTPSAGNLRGTRRTLDQCADAASLDEGLLSRDGWALFDDSGSFVWDKEQTWVESRPEAHLYDWYFFGYGHDYKAALREYLPFGGAIPLVPRYVLGGWWSRFWAYTDEDLKGLVRDFDAHDIPLDVLVVDMDWHLPDAWTGYTWNRKLFPDPEGFLRWVHEQNLAVTFNLHPAQGVQPHEAAHAAFSQRLGSDPAAAVPFQGASKAFIQAYFELLHHPMEEQGVDFWWLDWQQGTSTEIRNLDPLTWLNHLHFRDSTRRGQRPMLYSRWGGLGNHRYPIGFSGDTYTTWESLAFQPYFTATAANVAYGWWSHDIGGHFGPAEPELYARWVQYGALSPCLRLHSTKDPLAERRPWAFPPDVYQAAKAAFQFRYRLLPYLYSAAWSASGQGLSLCYPMYYEYPEAEDAYLARDQYFLGSQLIAAPVVRPADPQTGLAAVDLWIPEGEWVEFTTLERFTGPRWARISADLNHTPLLAKAGAIIPLASGLKRTRDYDGSELTLTIFPGADGHFTLYEDDGATEAYRRGEYETTEISLRSPDANTAAVTIAPAQGACPALAADRTFTIDLRGVGQPDRIVVNGAPHTDWTYNERTLTLRLPAMSRRAGVEAVVHLANSETLGPNSQELADAARLLKVDRDNGLKPLASHAAALEAALTTANAGAVARLGGPFAHIIDYAVYEDTHQQLATLVIAAPTDGSPFDAEITWELTKGGVTTVRFATRKECRERQIIAAPFHDEGNCETFRWRVSVDIIWRGVRLPYRYKSRDAYPAIRQWKTRVYNPQQGPFSLQAAMSGQGEWTDIVQTPESTFEVKQPFGVILLENARERIQGGEPLEACLTTDLNCPAAAEAVLLCQSVGEAACYLNGTELNIIEPVQGAAFSPMFPSWMTPQTRCYALPLTAGANQLVVVTHPDYAAGWWGVGTIVLDGEGRALVNG
jgi:alpha-glucosidase